MSEYNRLGDLLVGKKLITKEQLNTALARQKTSHLRLGEELVQGRLVSEEDILKTLAESMHLPFLRLSSAPIDLDTIELIPVRFVTHYNFLPLNESDGNLNIAVNDPLDLYSIDEIRLMLKRPIKLSLMSAEDISEGIKKYYGVGAETMARMVDDRHHLEVLGPPETETEASTETENPSVIKFIDQIIHQAIKERATDIHIEPSEDNLRVRYRIDGLLYDVPVPATIHHFKSALIIRLKIMSELDIAEKRLPQDGRIRVRISGEDYDLRVSILPTPMGESVEIRILSRRQVFFRMEQLGLDDHGLKILNQMIKRPHGIILVTGPTGSGKTTTLYSCLNRISSAERKIITIEDPIEYQLPGITQVQVHPKIQLTFANGLRSMLRHDPDIMMVGEIRDLETAELAIRTALTGHLVFSTLHTNDAAGAVTRLLDMGIEPYLVSSSLNCVIAQRLVRVICANCKHEFKPHPELLQELGQGPEAGAVFFKGEGCEQCKFTGYLGRTAIFEVLDVNDSIQELIMNHTPANIIKQKALGSGLKTLRQSGWEKILQGQTTPEEVIRVTQEDIIV